jgi:putative oxidoreductase
MSKIAAIIGRVLIGILFIASGISKLMDVGGTAGMLASAGLPTGLALPTAVFELVAGICLAAGFAVRITSVLLALFTAATILFFHNRFTDPAQAVALLKNLAIIGGLALAFAHSQMWWHYYSLRTARRGEVATRDAEHRVHEAELRAARAEARAEAVTTTHAHGGTASTGHTYVDTNGDGVADRKLTGRRRWLDW